MRPNIDNSKTMTAEIQQAITPETALDMLKKGNERFVNQKPLKRDLSGQVATTATGQYPYAIVLSCIDSRVPTEIVFDQGIGDIFNARVAGNIVDEDILGSIEFACKFAGSKLVVVMGHTACGAVKGACDNVKAGNLTALLARIRPAVDATETPSYEERNSGNADFVNRVAVKNTELTVENILTQSPLLRELHDQGSIDIVRAMYDVHTGKVDFLS